MNFVIISVGEQKESYYREAFAEYEKRMLSLGGLESVVIKPATTPGRELRPEEIRQALEKEGEAIRRALSQPRFSRYWKVALCVEGKPLSSEGLAEKLDHAALSGKSGAVFLIGSSWGLDESVKAASDLRLSFSSMTFPHSLFRVMLAEQIYRAANILSGGKYHK